MATLANSAEGGSNTTLVSAANSGGSSGDAWSSVNRGSAASAYTFSSSFPAHGSLGYAIQAASGEACQLIWTFTGGSGAASLFYYRHPGTPSAASQLATIRNGSGNAVIISVGTDNKLILQNAVGGNLRVSPVALAANDEVWISFRALKGGTTSNGTAEYAWGYKGSATIQDTFVSSAVNAGTADMASARYGRTTGSTWATTMYYDSIECETSFSALIPAREQRDLAFSLATAGDGTLTVDKTQTMTSGLALSGDGTLTVDKTQTMTSGLATAGDGTLTLSKTQTTTAALATAGSGTVVLSKTQTMDAALATAGSGTVTLAAVPSLVAALATAGSGTLTIDFEAGSTDIEYSLALSGSGTLDIATALTMVTDLATAGSGTVSVTAAPVADRALAVSGSGELDLDQTFALAAALAMSGTGVLAFERMFPTAPDAPAVRVLTLISVDDRILVNLTTDRILTLESP